VMEILGQSDISLTMNTHRHFVPDLTCDVAEKRVAAFGGRPTREISCGCQLAGKTRIGDRLTSKKP
jgi:hypothetical protein